MSIKGSVTATSGAITGDLLIGPETNNFIIKGDTSEIVLKETIGGSVVTTAKYGNMTASDFDRAAIEAYSVSKINSNGTGWSVANSTGSENTVIISHGSLGTPALIFSVADKSASYHSLYDSSSESWAKALSNSFTISNGDFIVISLPFAYSN